MRLAGIDYGSRLAGTTVIAFLDGDTIALKSSRKGQDADAMILEFANTYKPEIIGIDAPLSLPGVYRGLENFSDFHYRSADRQLGAMSPMFLGGLTARAMEMKLKLSLLEIEVVEVYPRKTFERLNFSELRKKWPDGKEELIAKLSSYLCLAIDEAAVQTAHCVDALAAFAAIIDYQRGNAEIEGDAGEGRIIF